jgi:hypothetical protein
VAIAVFQLANGFLGTVVSLRVQTEGFAPEIVGLVPAPTRHRQRFAIPSDQLPMPQDPQPVRCRIVAPGVAAGIIRWRAAAHSPNLAPAPSPQLRMAVR